MNYRFSPVDYIVFLLSYVFFAVYLIALQGIVTLPGWMPGWILLVLAVALNLWTLPLPGIHPRRLTGPAEAGQLAAPEETVPGESAAPEIPAGPSDAERLEKGLARTHTGFIDRIAAVFRRSGTLDSETMDTLEETLVGTDIGVRTAYQLFEHIKKDAAALESPEQAMDLIRHEITGILEQRETALTIPEGTKPFVIMVSGVNGSGKTTTIAKIARRFINDGKSVIVASGDTYRAAAIEQLEHWANKVGADFIRSHEGADPSAVAFDGLEAAIARGHDVLIVDTAGRLHTKENLMDELKKTRRVLDKKLAGAPHEVLLVLDATLGQNALEQTRQFHDAVGVTGITLTKLDGSAKGGVIVGIANEFDIPIRFIGVGEGMDDLQPFAADVFVEALFHGESQN